MKSFKHSLPNDGLMVICHGTIRKKHQQKHIQDVWCLEEKGEERQVQHGQQHLSFETWGGHVFKTINCELSSSLKYTQFKTLYPMGYRYIYILYLSTFNSNLY